MRRRVLIAASAAILALPSVWIGISHLRGRGTTSVRAYDVVIGPSDPAAPIRFALGLRLREQRLDRYLTDLHDPSSSRYRQYLGAAAFGRRFGPGLDAIRLVRSRLAAAGFSVGVAGRGRTGLEVDGTVGLVSEYLGIGFVDVLDQAGHRYHAPLTAPVVPRELAPTVSSFAGLNDRPVVPAGSPALLAEGATTSRLGPAQIAKAYDIAPLWQAGFTGKGQTVAIWSPYPYPKDDVKAFDEAMGIVGAPTPRDVFVGDEFSVDPASEDYQKVAFEMNLDIDVVRHIAPQAQILNYVPSFQGKGAFGEVARAIAEAGDASILSISYGPCDDPTVVREDGTIWLPPEERAYDEEQFAFAETRGINIFTSSGDTGAYECQRFDPDHLTPSTGYPDGPHVITVGGTRLTLDRDGNYLRETGWEQVIGQLGSGGGLNPQDPRPAWQAGPGVDNAASNGNRQVPDVAGPADAYVGFYMYANGGASTGNGTSQAAPFWAAVTALVQQYAAAHGVERIGFLPETLYPLAADPQSSPFHDVLVGGNRLHNCTPGWDYATGLGSPDAARLAVAVTRYLE